MVPESLRKQTEIPMQDLGSSNEYYPNLSNANAFGEFAKSKSDKSPSGMLGGMGGEPRYDVQVRSGGPDGRQPKRLEVGS